MTERNSSPVASANLPDRPITTPTNRQATLSTDSASPRRGAGGSDLPLSDVPRWFGCYGSRGDLFAPESYRHPAKMAVGLCFRIFDHGQQRGYWKPGDVILDPMAGIGTTGIVGAAFGYNIVLVELEPHFVEMTKANLALLDRKLAGSKLRGWVKLYQGDARRLGELLAGSDAAITSPPYAGQARQGGEDEHPERMQGSEWSGKYHLASGALTSPPYTDQDLTGQGHFRSRFEAEQPRAAENPREGYAGALTSPPYSDQSVVAGAGMTGRILRVAEEQGIDAAIRLYRETVIDPQKAHGRWSDDNIRKHIELALATKRSGYSAAISSPPYADASLPMGAGFRVRQLALQGKWDEAIALFQEHETEQVRSGMRRSVRSEKAIREAIERALQAESYAEFARAPAEESEPQIGNLHDPKGDIDRVVNIDHFSELADDGETYLSAMLTVYRELYQVLKVGGVVCLVTKNPVKAGRIRRLDQDTIRLMEAAGFMFLERQMAMLAQEFGEQMTLDGDAVPIRVEWKSFFKRLFERKRPDLRVDHEDVLWFAKV